MEKCRFLFFLIIASINAAHIEKGWEGVFGDSHSTTLPIMIGGNKSYLMVVNYQLNFMQAMDFCENIHMNLVTIENREESDRIRSYVINENTGSSYWTSGSKLLDGHTWLWLTTGDVFEFTNWGAGEPNGRTEFCTAVERRGDQVVWNDIDCDRVMNFICERPLDEVREDSNPDEKNWENVLTDKIDSPNLDLLHFRGKDYYFSREYKANYLEALDFCRSINMKLVTIKSKEENDKLYKYIRDTNAGTDWWSSGTRLLDGKNWVWLSDSQPITYTNWGPGEPSSINERCLQLSFQKNKGLIWNDNVCTTEMKVICERTSSNEDNGNTHENEIEEEDKDAAEGDAEFLKKLKETIPGSIPTVENNGRQFYVSRNLRATPSQSRTFCQYHNMKLMDIKNAEENSLLAKILPYPVTNGPFWVDGEKSDGKWVWKSSGQPLNYFNWQQDSPNDQAGLECLGVTNFGKFVDWNCKKKKPFVCERVEDENQTNNDKGDAIVNVFMTNNLITKKGIIPQAKELISSQYVDVKPSGGYHVTVDNDMRKC